MLNWHIRYNNYVYFPEQVCCQEVKEKGMHHIRMLLAEFNLKVLIPDKEKSLKGVKINQKWVEVGSIRLICKTEKLFFLKKGGWMIEW